MLLDQSPSPVPSRQGSRPRCAIGFEPNFLSALEFKFAVRGCTDSICTYLLEVCAKIDFLNIRIAG